MHSIFPAPFHIALRNFIFFLFEKGAKGMQSWLHSLRGVRNKISCLSEVRTPLKIPEYAPDETPLRIESFWIFLDQVFRI